MKYKITQQVAEDGTVTHSIKSQTINAKGLTMSQVWQMIQLIEGKEKMQFTEA